MSLAGSSSDSGLPASDFAPGFDLDRFWMGFAFGFAPDFEVGFARTGFFGKNLDFALVVGLSVVVPFVLNLVGFGHFVDFENSARSSEVGSFGSRPVYLGVGWVVDFFDPGFVPLRIFGFYPPNSCLAADPFGSAPIAPGLAGFYLDSIAVAVCSEADSVAAVVAFPEASF